MAQYIDKDALVAWLKERIRDYWCDSYALEEVIKYVDTLEVKEIETWHLQEKENIYDAVKGWSFQTFACVMKDGTIQRFTGYLDEGYEGHICIHIDGNSDNYDNVDDIVKWIEYT